jgi:prepilin-type N-terminal cleavage/methylation domain-containing protein
MAAIAPAVPPAPTFSQRGFTLTELAVVLVIVSLLIGGMLVPFAAQQEVKATIETQKTLNDVRDALYGFAAAKGRLPCPATLASVGVEQPAGGGACTCVSPDCFLPAATLGIAPINSSGQALDGWNDPIRYAVTTANTSAFTTSDGMKGAWSSLAPDLSVCNDSACAVTLTTTAAAVVWSNGKNAASGGTSSDEKENPNPQTASYPDPNASRFVSHAASTDFDDIVIWLSPNVLYNRMITAGKLP